MRLSRILLDPTAVLGGVAAQPAAPVAQPAAPAVPNPHPAAVQPAPAGVPNPLAPPPAAPTINYNIAAPAPVAPAAQPNVAIAAPTPAPVAPATPQLVQIPMEQLQAFTSIQARLAQMEAEQHAREQAAQQELARVMAQRGEVENALNLLRQQSEANLQQERQRAQQIEQAAGRYALDGELSRALASHSLVPGGAEQLATLWRGNFTAVNENGTYAVRTPTFETPAQFVARNLADPNYAHFLRAQNPHGGTATGQPVQAAQTPPAQAPTPTPPPTMGHAVIEHMRGLQAAQGDGRLNLSLPMGLRRA